jgi:hypothetical protein
VDGRPVRGPTTDVRPVRPVRGLTFERLKWASFCHSAIYLALLWAAFLGGKPEPATFALGLAHGLMWIGMSVACVAALRSRAIALRTAVAVAVLGGLGPFVGSLEFLLATRRRRVA